MKFLTSRELGRLAKWLRILGFDTVYFKEDNKSSFIISALREDRVVLTRNKIILKDRALKTLFIKSEEIKEQLKQIKDDLNIEFNPKDMFTRCILCNTILSKVSKDDIISKVPKYVLKTQDEFSKCEQCGRIYWQGTHWGNVSKIMKEVTNSNQ